MRAGGPPIRLIAGNSVMVGLVLIAFLVVLALQMGESSTVKWGLVLGTSLLGLSVAGGVLTAIWTDRIRYRSLRKVVSAARRMSEGDLSAAVRVSGTDELVALARHLNEIRSNLLLHTQTIDRQQRTQESLLSQLHEGVVVARGDGRVALVNPAAMRLLNMSMRSDEDETALIGQAIERCIPQLDLQRMLLRESITRTQDSRPDGGRTGGGVAEPSIIEESRLQVDSESKIIHLLARASDIVFPRGPSEDQPAIGRLLVLTDISELARTLQMKTDFVGNASHELRTPISTIRAAVETLLQMDMSREWQAAQNFVRVIDRQSSRLVAIVGDLLELARLESPLVRLQPEDLDLALELRDLLSRFAERIEKKHLRFQIDPPPAGRSRISANPQLLRLVLDNLVDNAIKFTEADGNVQVKSASSPDGISFEVIDTGYGIPDADQERVFERFYQVERARSGHERGTGLGLAIVRHAVAAMGGTVRLTSKVGQGTRVEVSLDQPR